MRDLESTEQEPPLLTPAQITDAVVALGMKPAAASFFHG